MHIYVQVVILCKETHAKSTDTLNRSIQQNRFLNILNFLTEMMHYTLQRYTSYVVDTFVNLDTLAYV